MVQGSTDFVLLPLEHCLDPTIRHIAHPACQTQGVRAFLGACAEEHSLHATFEDRVSPDFHGAEMTSELKRHSDENDDFLDLAKGKISATKAFYTHRAI